MIVKLKFSKSFLPVIKYFNRIHVFLLPFILEPSLRKDRSWSSWTLNRCCLMVSFHPQVKNYFLLWLVICSFHDYFAWLDFGKKCLSSFGVHWWERCRINLVFKTSKINACNKRQHNIVVRDRFILASWFHFLLVCQYDLRKGFLVQIIQIRTWWGLTDSSFFQSFFVFLYIFKSVFSLVFFW